MPAPLQKSKINDLYNGTFRSCSKVMILRMRGLDELTGDRETKRLMEYLSGLVGNLVRSVSEMHTALEDLETTRKMISRYPWHGTSISKLKHFELTWFLFQNLCYKFKEKVKLYHNAQKTLAAFLAVDRPGWLKAELKLLEKALGKAIRGRGNSVHSWDEQQNAIDFFSTVHLMCELKDAGEELDLPEGFFDLQGHYRDAKFRLKVEADRMLNDSYGLFERILAFHFPTPKELGSESNKLLEAVQGGAKLTQNKIE